MPSTVQDSTVARSEPPDTRRSRVGAGALDPRLLWRSTPAALRKFNPLTLWRNPVMFVVWVGAAFTTLLSIIRPSVFSWLIVIWLWPTVFFGNLAEAVAEGRGKAQADSLRRTRSQSTARRLLNWSVGQDPASLREESVAAVDLGRDDIVVVEAGELIPSDGEIVEGVASVDESAITGESAPVIREAGVSC